MTMDMSFTQSARPTPFHTVVAEHMHANDWVRWGDYTVARIYSHWTDEYDSLRGGLSFADLSPSIKYRVRGADASGFLDRLLTRRVSSIGVGCVGISPICDDHGHVLDIVRIDRLAEADFRLLATARHGRWLRDTAYGFKDVQIEDETDQWAVLGVHGVNSCGALLLSGMVGVEALEPNAHDMYSLRGLSVHVVRTRAFGELGYELWVRPDDAIVLWERLWRGSRRFSPQLIGESIREAGRIEAGYIVPGRDFVPSGRARHGSASRTPFELGLDTLVDLGKDHFVGCRRLTELAREPRGASPKGVSIVGLEVSGRTEVGGGRLLKDGSAVGFVTSSTWSPRLQRVVALATLTTVGPTLGDRLDVECRIFEDLCPQMTTVTSRIAKTPFYVSPARNARLRSQNRSST